MGQLSLPHLLILVFILLIFFGPSRLPQLGQSIGKAIKGFKDGLNEESDGKNNAQSPQLNQNNQDILRQASEEKKETKS